MVKNKKHLKLATTLIAPAASHGGWRADATPIADTLSLSTYITYAQKAEAAKLDFIFLPDQYSIMSTVPDLIKHGIRVWLEPITLMSALAAVTKHIGLGVTASTTYYEPFHLARIFASLDHISQGRAAWNAVISRGTIESGNFDKKKASSSASKHEQSLAFVAVMKALWDSWEDEAIIADKVSGVFADPTKVHCLNHESQWFSVKGPLNIARPPQGHPVIIQAGLSEDFMVRAAKDADVIFTQLNTLEKAQQFYRAVKAKLHQHQRMHDDLLLMPGLSVFVDDTEAQAHAKKAYYASLEHPTIKLSYASSLLGRDVTHLEVDDLLPVVTSEDSPHYQNIWETAHAQGIQSINDWYENHRHQAGHLTLVGTATQIVDEMEQWLMTEAADGFMFIPYALPTGLDDFIHYIIPELQRRNLFRQEYRGQTLREHLGLSSPNNIHCPPINNKTV